MKLGYRVGCERLKLEFQIPLDFGLFGIGLDIYLFQVTGDCCLGIAPRARFRQINLCRNIKWSIAIEFCRSIDNAPARTQIQVAEPMVIVKKLNPQQIDNRIKAAQVSGQINLQGNAEQQSARINLKDNSFGLNATILRTGEHITLEQFKLQRKKSQLTGQGKLDLDDEQSFALVSIARFKRRKIGNQ